MDRRNCLLRKVISTTGRYEEENMQACNGNICVKDASRKLLIKGYELLVKSGNVFQLLLLLFFRLNWGWLYFVTGKGKLVGHQQVVDFFTTLHLPFPDMTAWFVGGVECIGGVLLILGLAARPVGVVLGINMIVAYLSVESDRQKVLNFFTDQDPFFAADPFFFLLTALLAYAFGAGPLSLDALIKRLLSKKNAIPKDSVGDSVGDLQASCVRS
jgi:putative oxidoreductase